MNWLFLIPCLAVLILLRIVVESYRHKDRRPAPPMDTLGDEIHRHLLLGRSAER